MPPIRVLIADDHRLFRQGLRRFVRPWGVRGRGRSRERQVGGGLGSPLKSDVISVWTSTMPVLVRVQATQLYHRKHTSRARHHPHDVSPRSLRFEAIKAGAARYLLKDIDEEELVKAVRVVQQGEA